MHVCVKLKKRVVELYRDLKHKAIAKCFNVSVNVNVNVNVNMLM